MASPRCHRGAVNKADPRLMVLVLVLKSIHVGVLAFLAPDKPVERRRQPERSLESGREDKTASATDPPPENRPTSTLVSVSSLLAKKYAHYQWIRAELLDLSINLTAVELFSDS